MNHAFKSILVTLMLTGALNSTFGQVKHFIELRLIPGTDQLSDPGTTEVNGNDYVLWKIKEGEKIWSFGIVFATPLFATSLPIGDNYIKIGRTILLSAPVGIWKYKIFYRLTKDPAKLLWLDPKISVNPIIK